MQYHKHKESGLGDLLLVLKRDIIENIKKKNLQPNLTFSQTEVLRFIGLSGKETMKSIAHYLKITPPSVTELVAELEKKGLVKRKGDRVDRRVVFIVLTEVSKKLFKYLSKQKNDIFRKMISKLNKKDKKELERIIRILIKD